jgi:hypothetical protein
MRYQGLPDREFRVHDDTPKLTTEELFRRVQKVLADRATSTDRVWKYAYPLVSVLWSTETKGRMYGTTRVKSKGRKYTYYYTKRRIDGHSLYVRREAVERAFVELLDKLALTPAALKTARQTLRRLVREEAAGSEETLPPLRDQLERLKTVRRNLVRMCAAGDVVEEDFRREKALNDAAIRELEEHLEDLESPLEKRFSEFDSSLLLLSRLGQLWREMTDDPERRAFATLIFKRVVVNARGRVLDFQLASPFDRLYQLQSGASQLTVLRGLLDKPEARPHGRPRDRSDQ